MTGTKTSERKVFDVDSEYIYHISEDNYYKDVIGHEGLTFLYFWAPWCNPCKALSPIYPNIANEFRSARFCKVNSVNNFDIAAANEVGSLPTIIAYRNGVEVDRKIGMPGPEKMREWIKGVVENDQ